MVEVRFFASLREAAGTTRMSSDADTVTELLTELRQRHGEVFADRLSAATVLVDGRVTDHDSTEALPADAEVVLLPPFSGG